MGPAQNYDAYTFKLSYCMRQRVMIAMTLTYSPVLLPHGPLLPQLWEPSVPGAVFPALTRLSSNMCRRTVKESVGVLAFHALRSLAIREFP